VTNTNREDHHAVFFSHFLLGLNTFHSTLFSHPKSIFFPLARSYPYKTTPKMIQPYTSPLFLGDIYIPNDINCHGSMTRIYRQTNKQYGTQESIKQEHNALNTSTEFVAETSQSTSANDVTKHAGAVNRAADSFRISATRFTITDPCDNTQEHSSDHWHAASMMTEFHQQVRQPESIRRVCGGTCRHRLAGERRPPCSNRRPDTIITSNNIEVGRAGHPEVP
jgi:hypothetical protein